MELIAKLLLESRRSAYIEWLDTQLTMAINNYINKDSLIVLLSAKRKPTNHKAYHIPWSWKIIPTITLCTHGLFTPIAGSTWGVPLCEGFFWWA